MSKLLHADVVSLGMPKHHDALDFFRNIQILV